VTFRRSRVTTVADEEQLEYQMSVSVFLPYLPAKQSPYTVVYCLLWPACLYRIFARYIINGMISGKKIIENKMFLPLLIPK